MGTMRSDQGVSEEWAYHAEAPIGSSTYRLEDLAGIRVVSGDDRCFLTVWDDEPIQMEKFVLKLPGQETERDASSEGPEDEPIQGRPANGQIEGEIIQGEPANGQLQGEMVQGESENDQAEGEIIQSQPAQEMLSEEVSMEEISSMGRPEHEEILSMRTEGEVISGQPQQEMLSELSEGQTVQELSVEGERSRELPTEQTDEAIPESLRIQSDGPIPAPLEAEECSTPSEKVMEEEEKRVSAVMEELFRTRSHFQPFSDAEITNCIMIMPCDIMRLQQEAWQVGRSSFLQHGFYQHRHLLLGVTRDGEYVLGVPGVRNPQEQYMAGMFGFDLFKQSRTCERGKVFGYWCRTLRKLP